MSCHRKRGKVVLDYATLVVCSKSSEEQTGDWYFGESHLVFWREL